MGVLKPTGVHHHPMENGRRRPPTWPLIRGTHGFVSHLLRQLCSWAFLLFQYPRCQAREGTGAQKLLPRSLWAACFLHHGTALPFEAGWEASDSNKLLLDALWSPAAAEVRPGWRGLCQAVCSTNILNTVLGRVWPRCWRALHCSWS